MKWFKRNNNNLGPFEQCIRSTVTTASTTTYTHTHTPLDIVQWVHCLDATELHYMVCIFSSRHIIMKRPRISRQFTSCSCSFASRALSFCTLFNRFDFWPNLTFQFYSLWPQFSSWYHTEASYFLLLFFFFFIISKTFDFIFSILKISPFINK